jgi:caffeoyl-CoA O-methyltransferase
MSTNGGVGRSEFVESGVAAYAVAHSTSPDGVQRELRSTTRARTQGAAGMQIGDDQAVLLEILARATGARRAIEVGTFTGMSAVAMARGMGPEGRLICCDVSEEWTAIAREFWQRAGLSDRIELRLGPALETLRALPAEPAFDMAFVDADKTGYRDYYDELVPRLRVGGMLVADNTLQGGRVLDPDPDDRSTAAIQRFNEHARGDPRVQVVLLPIGDGVSIIQKLR